MSPDDSYGLRDYLEAKFGAIEDRLDRIENAGPRASAFGAAGTFVGAVIVILASAIGIKPPGQQ